MQLVRPDQQRVRIVVAHRHELVAEALGRLLESLGLLVVGAACDLDALLKRLPVAPAEVLVLDAGFDATAGPIVALQRIRDVVPEARVVVLAESLDGMLGVLLREGDLDGVVLASASGSELVAAVEQVVSGHSVFPAGWMRTARRVAAGSPLSQLSPRQREVLALLALGMDNDQIAARLYISRNTVKFHVRTIYERLGVHNRVEAARVLAGAGVAPAA
ncbi:MAG TPA: response regulator transcription factor [Solirubrobacteraceae bacterium]